MDDFAPTENFHENKRTQSTKTKTQNRKRANSGTAGVGVPENYVNKRERSSASSSSKPIRRTSLRLSQRMEKNVPEQTSSALDQFSECCDARNTQDRIDSNIAPSERIPSTNAENSQENRVFPNSFTAGKSDMQNLLHRLKEIKCKNAVGSENVRYHAKDEEISIEEFDKSMRVLDMACSSQEPLKIQRNHTPSNLGLVPFKVFENLSKLETDDKLPDNPPTVIHLSFDEDNEEDMFAEANDETEKIDKIDSNIGESSPPLRGFTSSESEHSQSLAASFGKIETLEKLESSDEEHENLAGPATKNIEKKEYERLGVECLPRIRELKNMEYPKSRDKKTSPDSTLKAQSLQPKFVDGIRNSPSDNCKLSHPSKPVSSTLENNCPPFSTASGCAIAISDAAMAKAQKIYKEIELVEQGREIQKEVLEKNRGSSVASMSKNVCPTVGFSTASGRTIAISDAAIARAQRIYKEIELAEPERKTNSELVEKNRDSSNDDERKLKNYISSSAVVDGSEATSSKPSTSLAQILFDETEDAIFENLIEPNPAVKNDSIEKAEATNLASTTKETKKPANIGFTTARGGELRISEKSLSKAQAMFNEIAIELNANTYVPNCQSSAKDSGGNFAPPVAAVNDIKLSREASSKGHSKEEKRNEIQAGFSTARGTEEASAKVKAQFDEIKDRSNQHVTPPNRRISDEPKKASSVGFKTAGGRELKISKEALSKAEAQYRSIENELIKLSPKSDSNIVTVVPEIRSCDQQKITERKIHASEQLASSVENPAIESCNLESLDLEDFTMDASECPAKRKFDDVDDDTPMRREPPWKRKKGRYVNDLQGRKLFDDNIASISIVGDTESDPSKAEKSSFTDEPHKMHFSDEIDASAAALMEDEELSMEITKKQSTSKNNDVASSAGSKEFESIPDDLTFDSQFSQDHHHAQIIDNFIMETMKIMEARLVMTSKQNETIRAKTRVKPEASDGSLYRSRTTNRNARFSWRELTEGEAPVPRESSGISVDSEIRSITANTAASYSFSCADFYGGKNVRVNVEGINVGDGAFLILDDRNCAGAREFEGAFLASPGVDPNLVPAGWVKNHYRWIVWKLASMDRVKFGHKCLPRMLTPNRVMLELKYRYDREIYRTQWPPLRRILEKNEDAAARLVLCVASISSQDDKTPAARSSNTPGAHGSTAYRVTLTDGWYSIPASIDVAMVNCIKSGKVKEGTKLVTFGAKAMNLDQGCSVLEIPASVTLRIHTNSTRRVKWDTKLDFCRPNRGPMTLSLKSVKPNGGAICKMVVAVARSYPVLYREKMPDGQFVFRNARSDEEAARAHEARCQARMEEICERARTEFQFGSQSNNVSSEAEIKRKIASELSECLPPPRNVTPVLKIRLAENETSAMMTIWSIGRETDQLFEEGSTLIIYNSFASGQRCNELQITAGRNTLFDNDTSRRISHPERICTSFLDIGEMGFNPVYGEFDTVGIVASIGPAPHGMKNFETVNLACPRPEDEKTSDFLSVLFWQGVSSHGYSKILTVGALVACSNLEWRRNTSRIIPTAYCTERTVFTKNPRQKHLVKPFERLLESMKDPLSYATSCATLIEEEIARKTPSRGTPGNGTPYRGVTYNRTTGWSPREPGTSGDVNSTPKNHSRKASIMRRIEKLEAYGEPPKLPSISINHSSPKVLSDFRSPVSTPVTKS